jgi:hypothetical protein
MLLILLLGEGRLLACIALQHDRALPISQARNRAIFEMVKI